MSTFHNNCICQICILCNCDKCNKITKSKESLNIYEILDSYLSENDDTDYMNISVNDNIDTNYEDKATEETKNKEEDYKTKIVKDSNSENEDIIKVKDIFRITVGTYVQQNITVAKANTEYFNNSKSEDTVTKI